MSQTQLQKKVADYLRKSKALEDYWQRPISGEQLQAEMQRMAVHTKKPEVLRELFAALGDDAFVIAECMARPALADRLLTNWYLSDERIHGELKQRAKSELQMHTTVAEMKQLSGIYSEVELVKSDSGKTVARTHRSPNKQLAGVKPAAQQDPTRTVTLNDREWTNTVQQLGATFRNLRKIEFARNSAGHTDESVQPGKLSPLQEDATRHYVLAVLERSENRLLVATVSWPKKPLESWLARAEKQLPVAMMIPQASYTLPMLSDAGGCNENTWMATAAAPEARAFHTAVWTGSEMIVWGGQTNSNSLLNSGGRYEPATDTWTFTNTAGAPSARTGHTAVWIGTEMIVWGGDTPDFPSRANTGGKYNPITNSWVPTSTTNAPDGRSMHTAVLRW